MWGPYNQSMETSDYSSLCELETRNQSTMIILGIDN